MKIHLIKKRSVLEYTNSNPNAYKAFDNWLKVIKGSNWDEPNDIILSFRNADILGNRSNRVVFDIGGNKYRCICTYKFGRSNVHLFINWIGNHPDYDKLCKSNLQYKISNY